MDPKLLLFLFLVFLGSTMAASVDFSRNSVDFSFDFYNKISKVNPNENVIISPLSVETAVGLVYMGAGGKTAEEIAKGLRLGTSEKSTVGSNFQELLDIYKNGKFVQIANKIYTKQDLEVKPEFNEIAKSQFNSVAENIDFTKSDVAAVTMNKWVEDKTNNKIKNLISANDLNQDTRMVLINAVHFKADWDKPFKKEATSKQSFHVSENDEVEVDMMRTTSEFKYGIFDDLKATALEMYYKDSDLSMLFILPNEIEGLPEVEEELLKKNILDISNEMQIERVAVTIPIFKIEFSLELKDTLSSMGMKNMFTDDADFSNLASEPLKVSKVIHKAFIEVNEKGTEAAAATAVLLAVTLSATIRPTPKIFNADHPFFFALKSKSNIIFSGKYVKNE